MDDQSKQDLKPELKEIYERIMKTPVQGSTGTSSPPPTSPMSGPTTNPPAGSLMGGATQPKQEPFSSPASSAFARETLTGQTSGQITETQMPKQEKPISMTQPQTPVSQQPSPLEDQPSSFSSVPPRPAQTPGDTSFVFSSTSGMQTENPMQTTGIEQPQAQAQTARGGNKILMIVAVVIFLAVYTVFWLIVFGVLDTSSLGLPSISLPFSLPFSQ